MNTQHATLCSSSEWDAYLEAEILSPLLASVDLGTDMLEMGPGFGAATNWLRARVPRLVTIELDPAVAERLAARFAGTNVMVTVGDCAHTEFDDESFDSVGTFTMLHHIPTAPGQHAVLAEAFRVLRPGGSLVGSDSLASNELHRFHADDAYNPIDPVRLLVELQVLSFTGIDILVDEELSFLARRPVRA
jgi:SAM-dependent methyltransferase